MPIYAYKCQGCGHQFDKIQRLSDARLTDCPECNQPELKKQITAAAFKLTGTGWYETDFKNNNKEAEKSSTTTAETSTEKSSNKSESTTKSKDSKSQSSGSSNKGSTNKDSSSKSSSNKDAA